MNLLLLSQISTVHAFCGALIRQYGYLLDISGDYQMLDDSEKSTMLQQQLELVLEEAYEKQEPGFCYLTDTLGAGRNDSALSELLLNLHNKLESQPFPQQWLNLQKTSIPTDSDLTQTPWGAILIRYAKRELSWLAERYDWAIDCMQGDELLGEKYLPCYIMHRNCLEKMLRVLDGPWNEIAPALEMDYPNTSVRNYPDKDFLEAIKAVKNEGKSLLQDIQRLFSRSEGDLIAEQNAVAPALDALISLVGELERRFSAEKRRKNRLDFSDQEHLAIRLLVHSESRRPTDVAREVSRRFTEIMVDEYQDSNRVQEIIFSAIAAGKDENRFLVGDVKQSIYGFRQAEPGIFLDKYQSFLPVNEAASGEPRKLVLSRNFRSRPEILEAVNHVFASVMSQEVGELVYGAEEQLYPGLNDYPSVTAPCVELHLLSMQKMSEEDDSNYQKEADWVTIRIAELLQTKMLIRDGSAQRPVEPGDIAILLRSGSSAYIYGRCLRKAGIPVSSGRGENLFETQEIRVLLNLLRVLSNPHQDVPLLSVLCSPILRLSNEQLAQIRTASGETRFYDAMRKCTEPWCVQAVERLEALRQHASKLPADQLIWYLLHEAGLLAAYSAMEDGKRRRENLLTVYQIALSESQKEYLYLYRFLTRLEQLAQEGRMVTAAAADGVIITTMHSSKGLEYPVVFLPELSRKFNTQDDRKNVLIDNDLGLGAKITDLKHGIRYSGICHEALKQKQGDKLLAEEMRILYVAMTRARDHLIMTFGGNHSVNALSRLISGAGFPAKAWAAGAARCPGDWILLSALSRIEAGALFQLCGRPDCQLVVSDYPWQIAYHEIERLTLPVRVWNSGAATVTESDVPSPAELLQRMKWEYSHLPATVTPSKVTATQLKGRGKDDEIAQDAYVKARLPKLKRPEFVLEKTSLSPTERGTAVHLFLQYADYSRCTTLSGVEDEKYRLEDGEFMTAQQLAAVSPDGIVALFHSSLGVRMLRAEELIREFKFSLLVDADTYYPQAENEKMLLQGVVDAAMIECDGITVIDFKTDRVTDATVEERANSYQSQLDTYRIALERIFKKPVKEMILYFLTIGKAVSL